MGLTGRTQCGRQDDRFVLLTPTRRVRVTADPSSTCARVVSTYRGKLNSHCDCHEAVVHSDRRYDHTRSRFKVGNEQGAWIVNNGYTRAMAIDAVSRGVADMVAFGKLFISNPDLVSRLRLNAPLAALDNDTLYGGNAIGYTDYPTLDLAHPEEQTPSAVARR